MGCTCSVEGQATDAELNIPQHKTIKHIRDIDTIIW
jgi:hypothetical protein